MIGIGVNIQRIQRWMTAVVFGACAPVGVIVFTLFQIAVDEGRRLLRTWKVEHVPERDDFQDLVDAIDGEAAEDANQLGLGTQHYVLMARDPEGQELGSLSLRYLPNQLLPGEPGTAIDSEPATHRGLAAMAMRHADAAYRMLTGMFMNIQTSNERGMAMKDRTIEKLMQFQLDKVDLMASLSGKQLEREVLVEGRRKEAEVELHRELAKIDREQMWMKMGEERIAPLIPLIADRFLRKDAAPGATTMRDEMLAAVFESMTPEQVAGLQGVLKPAQLANLARIAEEIQAARHPAKAGGGEPGAQKPARFTDETACLAVSKIKAELLPWAAARVKENQPLQPPPELAKVAQIFTLFVNALTAAQFDEFMTKEIPFDAEERKVFVRLAEAFKVVPKGAASGTAATDPSTSSGGAAAP
jgi:hypothetical protein